MSADSLLERVERYYSGRFAEHGPTPSGVDWNSPESQELRFAQLLRVCEGAPQPFSINDYGCGYGALYSYLERHGHDVRYRGFDISEPMLEHARREYERPQHVTFVDEEADLEPADYTVASGIFNVKLDVPEDEWADYVLRTLDTMARLSRRGFAFNMLTSYSDPDRMRSDLYYGDPCAFFDRCKRQYSRQVALLHDYGLWEFTMIVRCE